MKAYICSQNEMNENAKRKILHSLDCKANPWHTARDIKFDLLVSTHANDEFDNLISNLQLMNEADLVVFLSDWADDQFIRLMHIIAAEYGKRIIHL